MEGKVYLGLCNKTGYETVHVSGHNTARDTRKCVSAFVKHRKITTMSREMLPVVIAG